MAILSHLRLLTVFPLFFLSFHVFAQSDDIRAKLEQRVEETNKILPLSVKQGLVYKKNYIDNYTVYEIHEIDETYISFSALKHNKRLMKRTILKRYGEDTNLKSFAKLAVDCNMDVVIRYVSKQSSDFFELIIKTKDLEKCLK